MVEHLGSCHCAKLTFKVEAPAEITAFECNCSVCTKSGYLHLIVSANQFQLLSGSEFLTTYRFNTGVAHHLFCRVCGIKPFYVPRSHPDGYSVNVRCLEMDTIKRLAIVPFDGANWEQSVGEIRSE